MKSTNKNLPHQIICDQYTNDNLKISTLSTNYNCSDTLILKILKLNNIQIKKSYEITKKFKSQDEIDEIITLYNSGMTAIKISYLFNCSDTTISTLIKNSIT